MRIGQGLYKNNYYLSLVLLHIALGFILFLFEPMAKVYYTIIMVYFFVRIIIAAPANKTQEVLLGCAYFAGAEVLFRMTKGGLAYEGSKYLVIIFMLMGMFFKGLSGRGYPYFFYLIALVPAIIVASATLSFDARFRTNIAFVLSGPVCLGVSALFCYDRKVTVDEIQKVILYIALPSIATTAYLFFYNPSIRDTLSGTASNLEASGGFGPNQVATTLGLGIFAIVVRLFLKSPGLTLKIVNIIILGAMTFRAIVTFSRGGVIAAIIVVAVFLWVLFFKSSGKQKNRIIGMFVLFVIAISVTWEISSNQTVGLIDKRYANENASGIEKDDVSTGRVDLFIEEIDGFLSSPFLGIGASRVKDIRVEAGIGHLPSHNEIGRLLSEHGFLGILILLILIIKPLTYHASGGRNVFFYAFFCFWFATINHSGMRIAAPSFLYGLCFLIITNEKTVIYRQQIKK